MGDADGVRRNRAARRRAGARRRPRAARADGRAPTPCPHARWVSHGLAGAGARGAACRRRAHIRGQWAHVGRCARCVPAARRAGRMVWGRAAPGSRRRDAPLPPALRPAGHRGPGRGGARARRAASGHAPGHLVRPLTPRPHPVGRTAHDLERLHGGLELGDPDHRRPHPAALLVPHRPHLGQPGRGARQVDLHRPVRLCCRALRRRRRKLGAVSEPQDPGARHRLCLRRRGARRPGAS